MQLLAGLHGYEHTVIILYNSATIQSLHTALSSQFYETIIVASGVL